MSTAPAKADRQPAVDRQGFTLVISLVVMSVLVMTVVVISSLLTIETRLTSTHHLAKRARLNALVSLKLAVAHLQQEAGSDRRSTARGDITQPEATPLGDGTHPQVRNPLWTGVWRSDKPEQPPAWLVSGKPGAIAGIQSASLSGSADYPAGYWAPWQLLPDDTGYIELVGRASAADSEHVTPIAGAPAISFDKTSGFVRLPPIRLPDEGVAANYAYWVGDEGVKARLNMVDPRTTGTANSLGALTALRGPVNSGYELLPGLGALTTPSQFLQLSRLFELRNMTGYAEAAPGQPDNVKRIFHDVSIYSMGLLTDSLNGGLRRDLSLAFEMDEIAFANSELGGGTTGATSTSTENGCEDIKMSVPIDGKTVPIAPIFNRVVPDGNLRGPSWWAMRDYHCTYKELGWGADGTPMIWARAFYPNANRLHPTPGSGSNNSIRNRLYTYSDVFNGDQPSPTNPNAMDVGTLAGGANQPIPRPLNCAASSYIQRVTMVFGVNMEYKNGSPKNIHLVLNPVVVMHNPYNVTMSLDTTANKGAPACVSFVDWDSWTLRYKRYPNNGNPTVTTDYVLSTLFRNVDSSAEKMDMMRIYLPGDSIILQPGEMRVFSAPGNFSKWNRVVNFTNEFNPAGGLNDGASGFDSSATWDATDSLGFQVIPAGDFRVRFSLACYPGDSLASNNGLPQFYQGSTELNELWYRDMTPAKIGTSPEKIFPTPASIKNQYSSGTTPQPPDIIGAVELALKTPNDVNNPAKAANGADIIPSLFPVFTHSNPIAAAVRADGAGRSAEGTDLGYKGATHSYRARAFLPASWSEVLQVSGGLAYGGYTNANTGSQRVVVTELPLAPPTSLGQYAHANIGLRDQQPLIAIGNSFASPLIDSRKVVQHNGTHWTEYDLSYLLNRALWDTFFLSGAAPKMTRKVDPYLPYPTDPTPPPRVGGPSYYEEDKPLSTVLDELANGVSTLENPRLRVDLRGFSAEVIRTALSDYRRAAAVMLNDGCFNVNSTSVDAWTTFLGSAKNIAFGNKTAAQPAQNANGRYPRATLTGTATPATGNMKDNSNWSGFSNLTDDQIRKLAMAIVDENKARFGIFTRGEKEQLQAPTARAFGGRATGATPYLSLSEFINRFLTTEAWASRCGTLQAAIFRADANYSAGFSDRLSDGGVAGKLGMVTRDDIDPAVRPTASQTFNPQNIETVTTDNVNRTHMGLAAPGNLLQSDILALFGSAICTRSDTFRIRAYGDATNDMGVVGKAWVEAIVQRFPEFMDPSDPPETGTAAPKPSTLVTPAGTYVGDPVLNPGLTAVNRTLGRRFKIIAVRLLNADEI